MEIKIFNGPDNAFQEYINGTSFTTMNEVMMQIFETEHSYTVRTEDSEWKPKIYEYETIVCYRQEYSSMSTNLINNIMLLFKNVECNQIYFQNPPINIVESLQRNHEVTVFYHDFEKVDFEKLSGLKEIYTERIIGQERVLDVLLSVVNVSRIRQSKRPVVIMFYGPPAVGKTETAKILSEALYGNDHIKRFQLSMYQTEHAYKFLFGADPQNDSLAKDLLSRENNVILFDEFDKVHPNLYSAFYELFDEGRIRDNNYSAELDNSIFILTSNYSTKDEIKNSVGPAIFSRITECIRFADLSPEAKNEIMTKRFEESFENLPEEDKELLSGVSRKEMVDELSVELGNLTNSRDIKNTIEKYLSLKILLVKGIL
ncbi:AAA family ATPase [Halobacillus litoralis]|uniref:AAA family ATPase n=1 Tax=Halobacillus litoralis TaxID=45668 RepID=UPI001CD5974C|nr:AAA family ATPase [Halobacillus litoralis]MCA0972269.1 AAA family ATPase [Halobacillus litoralis]